MPALQNPTLRSGHLKSSHAPHMYPFPCADFLCLSLQKSCGDAGALSSAAALLLAANAPWDARPLDISGRRAEIRRVLRKAHARANATVQRHVSLRLPWSPKTGARGPRLTPSGRGTVRCPFGCGGLISCPSHPMRKHTTCFIQALRRSAVDSDDDL